MGTRPSRIHSSGTHPHNPTPEMTFDPFVCDSQIEEYIPTEDDWMSFYDDDQELEMYSLECAFGPEE